MTELRLTDAFLQALAVGTPTLRLTDAYLQVLAPGTPVLRLTDAYLQVLAPVSNSAGPTFQVRGFIG